MFEFIPLHITQLELQFILYWLDQGYTTKELTKAYKVEKINKWRWDLVKTEFLRIARLKPIPTK